MRVGGRHGDYLRRAWQLDDERAVFAQRAEDVLAVRGEPGELRPCRARLHQTVSSVPLSPETGLSSVMPAC